MRQFRMGKFIVASVFAAFLLAAGVASADYSIAGEWYGNRGPTINIPIGQFDGPCPPETSVGIPPFTASPIPASQWVPGPCGRAQKHEFTVVLPGNGTITIPADAVSAVAQSGIPADPQLVLGVSTVNPVGLGQAFRVPPGVFTRAQSSRAPVPANPAVQQLDTTFIFNGPVTLRTPSTASAGRQAAGDPASTRRMQTDSWSKPGMGTRPAAAFNHEMTSSSIVTRRVTYTPNANNFGGTMAMLLDGGGLVYIVFDLVTGLPGNEIGLSGVGDAIPGGITVHMGRGFNTTQMRQADTGAVFPTYNVPVKCEPNVIPPTPTDCGLVTGIINNQPGFTTMQPIDTLPGAVTTNTGFPWTTGHVSAYVKGEQGGVALTTTLTAVGNDSVQTGAAGGVVRTIQLVSGGVALRQSVDLGRTAHLETLTIQVPEPGSTLMLAGTLGLLGGLYSVRRRFF